MKRLWVLLALLAGACQSAAGGEVRAVLTGADPNAIEEIERTMAAALGIERVTLAPDAFVNSSTVSLEPRLGGTPSGTLATGRTPGRPEQFQLLHSGGRCVLLRLASGKRYELRGVSCKKEDKSGSRH